MTFRIAALYGRFLSRLPIIRSQFFTYIDTVLPRASKVYKRKKLHSQLKVWRKTDRNFWILRTQWVQPWFSGPKHPIWNFYKFYKSGGITMGYMCLLCSSALTGPPNTTNATKHLRSRHKNEYMMYFELIERFKRGTFFGDLHQSIREVICLLYWLISEAVPC